jgi:tetratricopeptide (TPR) repeat protein
MAISLNNIGVTYMDLRKYHKALTYLRRSLEMRKTMGYVYGIGLCSSNIAIVYWKQGKYEEAIHFAGENLEYQMRLGDKKGIATSLNNIGVIHKIHGEYKKALECHRKSYRIRREIGDRFGMTINLNQMGNIFLKMGEYGSALKANREEGNLCREMKNHPRLMNYYGLRANILVELQHYAAAYGYRERSLKINRELNLTLDEARDLTAMSHIIIISYLSGRKLRVPPEKAKKFLSRSLGIAKENHHWFEYSIVLSRFAMFNAMKKQHKKAMEQISEAEQICTENGFREFEPEVLFCKARILEMGGEKEAALKYLKRSKEGSKKLGLNPLVKKIDVLMKKMDGKKGISNQKIVIKGDWA